MSVCLSVCMQVCMYVCAYVVIARNQFLSCGGSRAPNKAVGVGFRVNGTGALLCKSRSCTSAETSIAHFFEAHADARGREDHGGLTPVLHTTHPRHSAGGTLGP